MSSEVIEMGGEKYLLTISKDITDRKQTEETLRMYLVAMNASIDGLAITGQDEEYVYLNAAHAQIYGYDDPEEIIGKTWRDLYDAEEITRIEQEVLPRLREEGRWRGEAIGKRRGGSTFYQELSLTQMAGNRIVSAVRDITERKLAVEKIRRLNEELEQRVIERTAQLEAANQDLKSFAYSVSHDLRAPLRAINGFAQIIARRHGDSLNEEAQHYFGNIVTASAHMSQLIDDLLLYSRVGRQAVRRQPVPLGALLAQVAANLSDRVAETGAHFSLPDDLPIVSGDHTLLTQVFTNLFDNALVYRRPGVVPRVVVKSQTKTDAFIISISDNGIGIPPEFHEKIFSIFQRLHSQEEYPGTGIGLAIVKKAAGLMGGQVWVESVVGQGSTFYVELPREAREVK